MIEGRILVTTHEVDRWIEEALTHDTHIKLNGSSWPETGWQLIQQRITDQCNHWHFGKKDRELIENHLWPLYNESKKFLELDRPFEKGTQSAHG